MGPVTVSQMTRKGNPHVVPRGRENRVLSLTGGMCLGLGVGVRGLALASGTWLCVCGLGVTTLVMGKCSTCPKGGVTEGATSQGYDF